MATDTSWGYEGWSSYSWGGQSQDITVYVGVQDGWGRSVWGSGGFGAYVADADLQLSALTGDTQVALPAVISVTGSQANIEIGTLQFSLDQIIDVTTNLLALQTGEALFSHSEIQLATGNELNIATPPVFDGWGLNAWGEYPYGGAEPIVIRASANVVLSSAELGIGTGTLEFSGKATVDLVGEQLTLTINDAVIIAKANAGTTTNLLDFLVQNPNIIAGGNVTDAVVGQELDIGVGEVSFKIDNIITATGSSVQIAIGHSYSCSSYNCKCSWI
jgi:hypothetical protein